MDNGNSPQADFRIPVVRHFIACEKIETTPGGSRYSLVNVIHAIKPVPGVNYPRIHPEPCLFVQMVNGRGKNTFRVQLVFVDDENRFTLPRLLYWTWGTTL
jgi:hypothetical protein